MALLQSILNSVSTGSTAGITVNEVNDLQIDSRKVRAGSAFIAIKGVIADGHAYINAAIQNGASVIVCEVLPAEIKDGVGYIQLITALQLQE